MNCSYDEEYLPLVMRRLGDMYDFAVNTLNYSLEEYHMLFLMTPISVQIGRGNPTYAAGMNGCEIAKAVILSCTGQRPETEDIMYLDKSPEYWIGWSLAALQWQSGLSFLDIQKVIPIEEFYAMYPTFHEADLSLLLNTLEDRLFRKEHKENTLKRLRAYAGLSQKQLALNSSVPLRQIQLFEQGQRDIRKTQGQTLLLLAKALNCTMEELIS